MSEKLTIITNNVPRGLLSFTDLTETEQAEFDYLTEDDYYSLRFFRYRGNVYDTNEFESASIMRHVFPRPWGAYQSDSFFSGVVIRYVDDYERVIVARYFS